MNNNKLLNNRIFIHYLSRRADSHNLIRIVEYTTDIVLILVEMAYYK